MDLGRIILNINARGGVIAHQTLKIIVIDAGRFLIEENKPLRGLPQITGLSKGQIGVVRRILRAAYSIHKTVHRNASDPCRPGRIAGVARALIDARGFCK